MRQARRCSLLLACVALMASGCPSQHMQHSDGGTPDGGVGGGPVPVHVSLRAINLCGSAIDFYASGTTAALLNNVQPLQVSSYAAATIDSQTGTVEIHAAGDTTSPALARSLPLQTHEGEHLTVALYGPNCTPLPLEEGFAAAQAGALRLRFVDTVGTMTPTRLYLEQSDGTSNQIAAVEPLGDSGPAGVVVPAAPAGRDSLRAQVLSELAVTNGPSGYQIPASLLQAGADLFVFNFYSQQTNGPDIRAELFVVPANGTPLEIRYNPLVRVFNALPDVCGNAGAAHFSFTTSAGATIAQSDVTFGMQRPVSLLPTATGHGIALQPASSCPTTTPMGHSSSGPLVAGGRFLLIAYGPGAAPQVYVVPDRLPAVPMPPTISFFNAASNAPPLDVNFSVPQGPMMPAFSAVAYGTQGPWISALDTSSILVVAQGNVPLLNMAASVSGLLIAIGDFSPQATVPARMVFHQIQ